MLQEDYRKSYSFQPLHQNLSFFFEALESFGIFDDHVDHFKDEYS
jgi:hypothetical protein